MPAIHLSDETEVAELARILTDFDDRRIPLLTGLPAGGRRELLRSGVERARRDGVRVLSATLDLNGYEPDVASVGDFAAFLRAGDAAEIELDPDEAGGWSEAVRAAAIFGCDADSAELSQRLASAAETGFEALDAVTASFDEGAAVVLHLLDGAAVPMMVRNRLFALAAEHPAVTLAISCHANDGAVKILRSQPHARFDVMPLEPGELSSIIEERLGVLLSPEQALGLFRRTGGLRAALAALAPAIAAGAPERDDLADALSRLPDAERKGIESFLHLAALCGDNIPLKALLAHLGVGEAELDEWIDRIDETVGADSDLGLFAERFSHPGFRDETVYGFRNPAFPALLRTALSAEGAAALASGLLKSFHERFALTTRGTAKLFAELCRSAGADADRRELESELSWWVGAAETDTLREELSDEIRKHVRRFEQAWMTANTVQFRWPPERTLAVLDAAVAGGAPAELQPAYHAIRAGLSIDAKRFTDAVEDAQAGLACCSDRMLESALLERRAAAQRGLGLAADAESSYAQCRSLREVLLDEGDPRVLPAIEIYVQQLHEAGHEAEAERLAAKLAQAVAQQNASGSA